MKRKPEELTPEESVKYYIFPHGLSEKEKIQAARDRKEIGIGTYFFNLDGNQPFQTKRSVQESLFYRKNPLNIPQFREFENTFRLAAVSIKHLIDQLRRTFDGAARQA